MKRALILIVLGLAAVACKPIAVQTATATRALQTQTLAVYVSSNTIGHYAEGYMAGQGDVLGVPGYDHCHTPPDLGWLSETATMCEVEVPAGTTLTLAAVSDDTTSTGVVSGDCTAQTATTCTVTMDGTRRVYASFSPVALWVTTTCWPEADCAVATEVDSYNPEPVRFDFYDRRSDYSRRMTPGSIAMVVAYAVPGYDLRWGAPCTDIVVNNTCTLTIDELTTLDVNAFGPEPL